MIRKLIKYIIILVLLLVAYGYTTYKTKTFNPIEGLKILYNEQVNIELNDNQKATLKDAASDVKYKVYEEATEHNPEGDVLPDSIDDNIKSTIKNEVKEKVN